MKTADIRIGHGYDVHRLTGGRRLILGGVDIPFERGLMGHSDADVLTHAVMDSMLGACAMGDIGRLFPDSDSRYRDADSMLLLQRVIQLLYSEGWELSNLDVTVAAQAPKLMPFIQDMRENLARYAKCDISQISVKATTEEGLGFTGEGLGISATAVCIMKRTEKNKA